LSPSGTGLHIFLRGAVSKSSKIDGCEIYSKARYFTVTGKHIPTTPLTIAEPTVDELEQLREDIADGSLRPKVQEPPKIGAVIRKIEYTTQAERETKLDRALSDDLSEYGDNRSDAVYGVMQLLARKHQGNEEAMLEEFEASELCNSWGGKWDRLRDKEIAKGIANWKENGSPKWEDDKDAERPWELRRFSQMEAKPVNWIWPGYLAAGKLTTISGEPGHGKSMIALDIAARVTTGKDFPDGSKNTLAPSEVLLLTVEEDHEDTVLPRFLLAGGDPAKLIALYVGDRPGLFSLEESSKQLRQLFTENPQIRLLILDPMLDFVRADQNKDADVRAALNGLADIASEFGFAVVGINHFNKKSDMDAIHRVAGSRGWTAVARINHIVGRTEDGVRHLCNLKTNIAREGSSLDFNIEQRPLRAGKIKDVEYPYVSWIGKGSATANDITMSQRPRESKVSPVEEWLKELLADGEWHSSTDIHDAGDDRFSKDSIKRALNRVRAQYEKRGMPAKGYWRASEARDSQRISETEVRL
jgi:putative DNA primase/helicase